MTEPTRDALLILVPMFWTLFAGLLLLALRPTHPRDDR